MYNSHFGLERSPFKITPDTTLFYKGGQRGRVLEALVYAILSGEGIIKVVGEVGTGKTMLCRMLHAELPPNVEVVYLANPSLAPEEIHHAIAMEMGLTLGPGATRLEVLHTLQQHMLDKYARNEHVVVLVEEAQSMPKASLEEIRLLSNLETRRDKLLQVVLFGQPELDTLLSDPTIRQLRERITHSFQLEPLNLQEVREYVNFRLRSAGFKGRDVFDEASYELLARVSKGLSRRINILADKALLAAFAEDTHDVRRRHVKVAVDDSEMTRKVGPGRVARRSWGWPESVLAAGALLVVAAIVITVWRGEGFVLPGLGTSAGGVTTEQGKVPPRKSSAGAALAAAPEALAAEAPDSDPGEPDTRAKATDSAGPAAEAQAELGGGLEATLADRGVAVAAEPEPFRPEVSPSGERQRLEPMESGAADMPVQEAARSESEGGPVPTLAAVANSSREATADAEPAVAQALVDARVDAARRWLGEKHRSRYSIQIMVADAANRSALEKFLSDRQRAGDLEQVYCYPSHLKGRPVFTVFYKSFPSFEAATSGLSALPARLKRHRPYVRNMSQFAARERLGQRADGAMGPGGAQNIDPRAGQARIG